MPGQREGEKESETEQKKAPSAPPSAPVQVDLASDSTFGDYLVSAAGSETSLPVENTNICIFG